MAIIHPLATVHPGARLADDVEVGPYAFIDDNVEIGPGCKILPHATIFSYVKMGRDCNVFPGAVVGAIPQDLKFDGEVTWVEIGDRVNIRECATINRGTKASGKGVTRIGSDTLIMSYVHVAHDCCVGNHCILVSYVGIAGETDVDDWAIIGGGTKVHQFTKIGTHAMVGGGTAVNKRTEFLRMIDDAEAGKIDYILVKSISRFSRNTVDLLQYVRELKEIGVLLSGI